MKNAMQIVSLFIVSLVLGCTASAQVGGSKSPVDWREAYVSGPDVQVAHCDKNKAGEAAYYACLEELDRGRQQEVLTAGNGGAKQPAATASAKPPVPPQPSATAAVPPAQQPPLVGGAVPQNLYIPGAVGAICETNKALQLVVENQTDYVIEVRGGTSLAPLGCDAQNTLVLATILRRDGRTAQAWVIPPHTTSIWVFLPLNGGLGQPKVNFTAYMPLACQNGVCPPSPAVGQMNRQYFVPRRNGQETPQIIQSGFLQPFTN